MAGTLHAIASGEPGHEAVVLLCLNLLDDVLNTIECSPELPNGAILDQLVARLAEGEKLPSAVEAIGGSAVAIEPILSSLGRLLAWSTFSC